MRNLNTKMLLFIAIGIFVLVVIIIMLLLTSTKQTPTTALPTPTQAPGRSVPERSIDSHPDSGPFPPPNPTFIQLLETEPFWDMLPHRTDVYLIEHIMHNNTIRITTIDPGGRNRTALIQSYRNQALEWLEENGANIAELTIEYVPQN